MARQRSLLLHVVFRHQVLVLFDQCVDTWIASQTDEVPELQRESIRLISLCHTCIYRTFFSCLDCSTGTMFCTDSDLALEITPSGKGGPNRQTKASPYRAGLGQAQNVFMQARYGDMMYGRPDGGSKS